MAQVPQNPSTPIAASVDVQAGSDLIVPTPEQIAAAREDAQRDAAKEIVAKELAEASRLVAIENAKRDIIMRAPTVVMKLRAVHGLIIHPFDQTKFDTDRVVKHDNDAWVKAQLYGEKLVEDND